MTPVLPFLYCFLSLSTGSMEAQYLLQTANSAYSSNCWLCLDASRGGTGSTYVTAPKEGTLSTCLGSMSTKIGMIRRRLAWPLCKDDTQIHEVFHIFVGDIGFYLWNEYITRIKSTM